MPIFHRDGAELYYELDGSGPPIVYCSGFSGHSNDFLGAPLRAAFRERYTVLSLDHRGAGQTVVEEGVKVSVADMADDIAAIMDHHGLGAAHMLGISTGGAIAMMLALRHPGKVRSLVLAAAFAQMRYPSRSLFMLETLRLMRDADVPRPFITRVVAQTLFGDEAFQNEDFLKSILTAPRDPHEQTRIGFDIVLGALSDLDILDQLPSIGVPTLVMSSPEDVLVPPSAQDDIEAAIPNAEIKRYPGGHVFMALPSNVKPFMEDVISFWDLHN